MSNIRSCFTSRFGEYGQIVELDYSQLEIYVLAYLSGDKQLKHDLLSGVDLHGISAERLFGSAFTPAQRTLAKSLSFQLQYGAGYASMAAENNIPELLAKKFIKNYFDRYPDVKRWQDETMIKVHKNRTVSSRRTANGFPAGTSTIVSVTGRRYTFTEKDAPDWMSAVTSFSPTEVKNYPVQGLATGDIVPMVLGRLYRHFCNFVSYRNGFFMVGTVHDSVLFDCINKDAALMVVREAKRIMESIPATLKSKYEIDFDLPLKVEAKIGPNWMELTKYQNVV